MTEERKCPKCKALLKRKYGKNGPFWGCTAFPECDYTISVKREDANISEDMSALATTRFALAVKFIQDCGSVDNAIEAVRSVAMMLETCLPTKKEQL